MAGRARHGTLTLDVSATMGYRAQMTRGHVPRVRGKMDANQEAQSEGRPAPVFHATWTDVWTFETPTREDTGGPATITIRRSDHRYPRYSVAVAGERPDGSSKPWLAVRTFVNDDGVAQVSPVLDDVAGLLAEAAEWIRLDSERIVAEVRAAKAAAAEKRAQPRQGGDPQRPQRPQKPVETMRPGKTERDRARKLARRTETKEAAK